MFPEVPGVMSLHDAPWLMSICPIPHGCIQQAPKNHSFLSACASLEFPHCKCCAQHTWTRWAFKESQYCWEEDWRTSSLPTTEGSAQAFTWRIKNLWPERRQPALLVIFLERRKNLGGIFGWSFKFEGSGVQNRHSPCSLSKAFKQLWLHARVEDLALMYNTWMTLMPQGKRPKQSPNISQFNSFRGRTINIKKDEPRERYSRTEDRFFFYWSKSINPIVFDIYSSQRSTLDFLYINNDFFFLLHFG